MSISIERLIVEIESRPALWDCRAKEYSERLLKRDAWKEVCSALDPNYDDYTKAEKMNTGDYFISISCVVHERPVLMVDNVI